MANVQYLLPDEQSRTAATVNAVMTVNHLINTHTTTTTTTINNTMSSIETMNSFDNNNNGQDRPCEKYRQFIDSSVQERTFMIGKLVGKDQSNSFPPPLSHTPKKIQLIFKCTVK